MSFSLPALPDKNFFSMGEVSRFCGVSPHTIRYWERRAGIPRPARMPSGHRRYERKDIEATMRLKNLLQSQGMTLSGARKLILRELRSPIIGNGDEKNSQSPAIQDRASSKIIQEIRSELQALLNELSS